MVLQRMRFHRRGLSLPMQRKVFVLRTSKTPPPSWKRIASQIRNLENKRPYWKVCRDVFAKLKDPPHKVQDAYKNCGRRAILTKVTRRWIVSRLLSLRRKQEVTSTDLQAELAKEKGIHVEASSVRRALKAEGYRYLSRCQKPRYSKEQKEERYLFSSWLSGMSWEEVQANIDMSMDGVVFTRPPDEIVERENYCKADVTRVWRRPDEHSLPELAGHDPYAKQVPADRIIPVWGGIGRNGFAAVLWHDKRKTNQEEWSKAARSGKLVGALNKLNPVKGRGRWKILSDNESFLRAPMSVSAHTRMRVDLVKLPAKSPDLNPVEKMWGWTRKRLRKMDLADLSARRPVLGRSAYRERIRRLLCGAPAQAAAKNFFKNLHSMAKKVAEAGGTAVRG